MATGDSGTAARGAGNVCVGGGRTGVHSILGRAGFRFGGKSGAKICIWEGTKFNVGCSIGCCKMEGIVGIEGAMAGGALGAYIGSCAGIEKGGITVGG